MDEEMKAQLDGIKKLIEGGSVESGGVKAEMMAIQFELKNLSELTHELKRTVRGVNGSLGMLGDVAALKTAEADRADEEKYNRRLRWAQIAGMLLSLAAIIVALTR